MALIDGLSFVQNSDITYGVASDTSDYGVGGNPLRSATANYLLWSKTNGQGVRTFDNPDQGDVLSTLIYQVNTPVDGYYEGILIRVAPYDNGDNYVEQQQTGNTITQYASVVYDAVAGKSYYCILPVTGVAPSDPSGATYWTEITDFSTILDNTNIDVFIQAFYIKVRSMICVGQQFKNDCGCGCNGDFDKARTALLLSSKLMSADAEFANSNYTEMEKIIVEITSTCSSCG